VKKKQTKLKQRSAKKQGHATATTTPSGSTQTKKKTTGSNSKSTPIEEPSRPTAPPVGNKAKPKGWKDKTAPEVLADVNEALAAVAPTEFPFGANAVVKCKPCAHCGGPVSPSELSVVLEWGKRTDDLRHLGRPATKIAHDKCDREARGIKPRVKKEETAAEPSGKTAKKAPVAGKQKATGIVRNNFAGCKLRKLVKDNPRKAGTHGFNSFNVIKDGMTFEAYITAGGRANDLRWDVEHNWVEVK
jgi:hypothetical protein